MKNILMILAVVAAMSFASCNYLSIDQYFGDELALDSIFKQKRYVEAYLWGAAAMIPDDANMFWATPGPLATDEAVSIDSRYSGMRYVLGKVSATSGMSEMDNWGLMYRIIRQCNTLLYHSGEAPDMTPVERIQAESYARFFRAYAYYWLLVNVGPPILLGDEVVGNNETLEVYNRPRSTCDEAMEYICGELEDIAPYLPASHPMIDAGKPTKGAAYGLVARLRLIHASPLYNGGQAARTTFGRWTRSTDGAYYVSQTNDERRWAVAAAACKRVMDMNQYELFTVSATANLASPPKPLPAGLETVDPDYYKPWPEGAAGIDHFRSYSDIFTGEEVLYANKEAVWGRNSADLLSSANASFPVTNGGANNLSVTQKVVDAYYMFDGRDKADAIDDGSYSESGFTDAQETFSGYQLNARVYKMYANREMRFYASIGFSNARWPLASYTGTTLRDIEYFKGSANGRSAAPNNYPLTGYVLAKYNHKTDSWGAGNNARVVAKWFGIIRYAEILLSYAEALNNLTTAHNVEVDGVPQTFTRDTEAIRLAFGQVRHRAGLPAPSADELRDPAKMQQLIERERMIEFLCENRRYYDVRRWGIYEDTEYEPITGMNADADGDAFFRRVVPNSPNISQRVVNRKMILLPIPLSEVRRLPSLDQNPGWEQ